MNACEYASCHMEHMHKWNNAVRDWLKKSSKNDRANFYMDGIIDPKTWFAQDNTCRPLFILKEVHESSDFRHSNQSLMIDFVATYENETERCDDDTRYAYDIWDGNLTTWRKIGALANGILQIYHSNAINLPPYYLFNSKTIFLPTEMLSEESLSSI